MNEATKELRSLGADDEAVKRMAPVYAPIRLLLVEDDAEMRALLAQTLREQGYLVMEADNGPEALDMLRGSVANLPHRQRIDVVVADARLPGLSGLEILEFLRQYDRTTAFVLISAFMDEDMQTEAARLGADASLSKPFRIKDLLLTLCSSRSAR